MTVRRWDSGGMVFILFGGNIFFFCSLPCIFVTVTVSAPPDFGAGLPGQRCACYEE